MRTEMAIIRRLIRLAWQDKRWLILAALAAFLTVASSIGLLMTSAYVIAKAALHPSIAALSVAIVGVRFFGIARGLFRYLDRLISHEMTFRLLARIRVWFYDSLEPRVPTQSIAFKSGDLLTRMVTDVNSLEGFYVRVLSPPTVALLIALLMWVLLGCFSGWFALTLAFAFVLAGIVIPLVFQGSAKRLSRDILDGRTRLQQMTLDLVQGLAELRLFNQTETFLDTLDQTNASLVAKQHQLKTLIAHQRALITGIMNATILTLLVIAIQQVQGTFLDGVFISVIVMGTMAAFEVIAPLPVMAQDLHTGVRSASRLLQWADPKHVDEPISWGKTETSDIEFQKVSFQYEDLPVLKDISFVIRPGEKVAFVGPSGSGKSTLIHLMLGHWQPDQGNIRLHHDICDSHRLPNNIAVTPQRGYFFSTPFIENLTLAQPDASHQAIMDVLNKVQLADLVKTLPQGLETWVGEHGHTLSGGEQQRLAIARTLLTHAPIQVFDEPTAHLDPEKEKAIMATLLNQPDRTVLLLTHRLVGLEKLDRIYVLYEGRIVESGTHQALMTAKGLYYNMVTIQNRYLRVTLNKSSDL